jgi:hypothetical protein
MAGIIASKAMERSRFIALDPLGAASIARRALARESTCLYARKDIRPPFLHKGRKEASFQKLGLFIAPEEIFLAPRELPMASLVAA